MDTIIAILSWTASILLPLLIISMPVDSLLQKQKNNWRGSKEQKIYKTCQMIGLGVFSLCLMATAILMFIPL